MAKSNYKLIFKEELQMYKFASIFFEYIQQRKGWFNNCNFHSRNNILYVYTHNYTMIDNFIKSYQDKYNYNLIKINN